MSHDKGVSGHHMRVFGRYDNNGTEVQAIQYQLDNAPEVTAQVVDWLGVDAKMIRPSVVLPSANLLIIFDDESDDTHTWRIGNGDWLVWLGGRDIIRRNDNLFRANYKLIDGPSAGHDPFKARGSL